MKSIIKEVISMTLIAIAMLIILVLVFYDYLNINTEDSDVIEYSRDAEVQNALNDDTAQSNQIIASLSKSMYSLNSDDVSEYVSEGIIDRGKKHPFSDIESNTYDTSATVGTGETTTSTSSSTSTSGNNSDNDYNSSNSGNSNSNNSSSNNSSSTSQNDDTSSQDEDDEDDDKPFFDTGTTK